MNLTKKTDQQKNSKPTSIDWKLYEVDHTALIPYGKYAHSTLQEVKEQDSNYYKWILTSDMIESWGLYKIKGSAIRVRKSKPQWSPWYNPDTGETYMGYREAPGNGVEYKD